MTDGETVADTGKIDSKVVNPCLVSLEWSGYHCLKVFLVLRLESEQFLFLISTWRFITTQSFMVCIRRIPANNKITVFRIRRDGDFHAREVIM